MPIVCIYIYIFVLRQIKNSKSDSDYVMYDISDFTIDVRSSMVGERALETSG